MSKDQNTADRKPIGKTILRYSLWLIGILALLAIYFLITDEKLSPLAEEWFGSERQTTVAPTENAYFFWAGFGLPRDINPIEFIDARVKALSEGGDSTFSQQQWEIPDDSVLSELNPFVEGGLGNLAMLRPLLEDGDKISDLQNRTSFLQDRYKRLAELNQFETPFKMNFGTPFPGGTEILRYQSFRNLLILHELEKGNTAKAITLAHESYEVVRNLRAGADYMLAALSTNVLMLRYMMGCLNPMLDWQTPPAPEVITYIQSIPLLGRDELSLREAFHNEGRIAVNSFTVEKSNIGQRSAARPNATRNLIAKTYNHLAELSELPGPQYMELRNAKFVQITPADYLRSLAGVLQVMGYDSYIAYVDAGHSNNGYLMLLKAKAAILEHQLVRNEVESFLAEHQQEYYNPFTGGPLEWDEVQGLLWFTGPDQEEMQKGRQVVIQFSD